MQAPSIRSNRALTPSTCRVFALGLLAAMVNCAGSVLVGPQPWPDLGILFLFLAVGALPLPHAIASACIAALIEVSLFPERIDMLRSIFLVLGAATLLRAYPKLPIFAAIGILWLGALTPTLLPLGEHASGQLVWSNESLILMGMWDTLLAVVAGLALLNPLIWSLTNGKQRHVSLQHVLAHGIAGATLFPLIGAVLVFGLDSFLRRPETALNLLMLIAFSLVLAVWLSERIALLFAEHASPLLQSSSSPGRRFRTLSRLASAAWLEPRSLWRVESERSVPDRDLTKSRAVLASAQGKDLGICALTRTGTVTFMNERFRELCGIQIAEPLGRLFAQIPMDGRIADGVGAIVEQSFEKGENCSTELRLNELPNRLIFLNITTEISHQRTVSDAQNIIVGISDITSRRTVSFDRILAQRKESLHTLVSGMSHALNNSLTKIVGHAATARLSQDPFSLNRSLDEVITATKESSLLVRQLLDFSDARSYCPKLERLDLLLKGHRDVLAGIAGRACELNYAISEKALSAQCDAGLILLAITNLVINARDSYAKRSGPIWVALDLEELSDDAPTVLPGARKGSFVRIHVRDSGQGVSPEILRRMLNPEHCQNSPEGGAALALATAYAIIRAHDGFLVAESHPEKGTSVSMYLPLVEWVATSSSDADSSRQSEPIDSHVRSDAPKGSILVVEDDDTIRDVVRSMLSSLGYSVHTSRDGADALAKCSNGGYDLVLVDLVMPKMYGLEVIERLRTSHPNIPTLLMSGSGHLVDAESTTTRLLPKPFDIETLERAVRESLSRSRARMSTERVAENSSLTNTLVH